MGEEAGEAAVQGQAAGDVLWFANPSAGAATASAPVDAGVPTLPMKRKSPPPEEPEAAVQPLMHIQMGGPPPTAAPVIEAAPVVQMAVAPATEAAPVVQAAAGPVAAVAAAVAAAAVSAGPPVRRPRGRAPNDESGRPKVWNPNLACWVEDTGELPAAVPGSGTSAAEAEKQRKNAERQRERRERGDWNPQDEQCCPKYAKNTLKSSRIKGDPMLAGMLENHKAVPATPFWRMLCSNDYHTTRREITNFRSRQQQKAKKAAAAGLAAAGPLMALPYAG